MEGRRVTKGGRKESNEEWKEGESRRVEVRRVAKSGRKESSEEWKEGE